MNTNEYIVIGDFIIKLESIRIKELITSKYKDSYGIVPSYQRGLLLIDSIFISASLEIESGGYFPFGYVQSDY